MDEIEQDLRGLKTAFVTTEVVGISVVVMMSVWTGHYMKGFAGSSNPDLEFNWHPLLMTISLIYLYGNGILVYRIARNERKSRLKVAHAVVMGSATVLACLGLKAVFDFHFYKSIPHTYSLHAWLGLLAISLAVLQWVLGMVTFLWPGLASHLRSTFLPLHIFTGLGVFLLSATAALLGITEKAIFRSNTEKDFEYKDGGGEAVLINLLGISIILFVILVLAIATKQSFKRLHRPEDQMLLTESQAE